jgi:Fic family protein
LSDLDFADDVATLSLSLQESQRLTDKLCTLEDQIGLQINFTKTKIMGLTNATENIASNGQTLEKVQNFTYLGSKLSKDGDTMKEINTRIAIAGNAFTKLTNIWKTRP